ncbi:MAG: amidohydrolase [Candidatus Eremiobacteraeota bacterium]|nr:amidohydrolase [Candidatus Eremiobacteraeota bacterium]
MRRSTLLAGLAAVAGTPIAASAAPGRRADLIVSAATIRTGDPSWPFAQAFAVRDGRIALVGSRGDMRALRGPGTQSLDLGNAVVWPGLIDAHLHFLAVGLALHEVDLAHVASYEEVVRRTVAFANGSRDPWIVGDGWDQNLWPDKQFPNHAALSAAIPDRPVVLHRVDGHALLANAKAMALAGVTASTAEPSGGRILRDASGAPTGVFVDNAMGLIGRAIPPPSHAQLVRASEAALKECHRWGLTAVGDPGVDQNGLDAYEELLREGRYTLRNHAMLAGSDDELVARWLQRGPQTLAHGGRLSVRAIKLYVDGALGSRGAALLAPYSDDPGNTGLLRLTQAQIQSVCERALPAGFQVCTHAIGDRGNRVVLDAYEAALRRSRAVHDHRWRIEHAQVLAPDDIPRFARLGVTASMQTTHQVSDMPWAQARLGPQRVLGAYAWRSLLDSGVPIANGTDAPVEAVNSLRTFHAAIARQNEANQPPGGWYPRQRMTRDEAFKSMTSWAARACFLDGAAGTLEPGKYADFVVLDRDPMRIAPEEIMSTRVLATFSGGERVYAAPIAAAPPALRARGRRNGTCCGAHA